MTGGRTRGTPARRTGTRLFRRRVRRSESTVVLALRGLIATVLAVAISAALVSWGNGAFDRTVPVTATFPAEAGRVTERAPVRFAGVEVGHVTEIDANPTETRVRLDLSPREAEAVPASVVARIVPKTLFGDVAIDLIPMAGTTAATGTLTRGSRIPADRSGEAVELYRIYQRLSALLESLEPARMGERLAALDALLSGRGSELRAIIERGAGPLAELAGEVTSATEHLPRLRAVVDRWAEATPEVRQIVENTIAVSEATATRRDRLAEVLSGGVSLGGELAERSRAHTPDLVLVTREGRPLVETLGRGSASLAEILDEVRGFAGAGARTFSTGRFSITAVPSFDAPTPYTSADCLRYGPLAGTCSGTPGPPTGNARDGRVHRGPVIGAANRNGDALHRIRSVEAGRPADEGKPDDLETLLLGPHLRGGVVVENGANR